MIREVLEGIRTSIMGIHRYYNDSYIADGIADGVVYFKGGAFTFPSDAHGDYFYLRHSGRIAYRDGREEHTVYLVGYAQDLDVYRAVEMLNATLTKKCLSEGAIKVVSAVVGKEDVIKSEVAAKGRQTALRNFNERSVVFKIEFIITLPKRWERQSADCYEKPCADCT